MGAGADEGVARAARYPAGAAGALWQLLTFVITIPAALRTTPISPGKDLYPMGHRAAFTALALAAGLSGAPALADPRPVVVETCLGCHGIENYKNAYPTYHVPKLGGQHAQYIMDALKAYASGDRPHSTMHAQAATLSDEDIRVIAEYFEAAGQ